MKQKLITEERVYHTLFFTLLFLPLLFLSGYLVIESAEKASGFYPIIPERVIQINSMRSWYHDQCYQKQQLQGGLHHHKDELDQATSAQTSSQIEQLEKEMSKLLNRCDRLSDTNCSDSLECPQMNRLIDSMPGAAW